MFNILAVTVKTKLSISKYCFFRKTSYQAEACMLTF